MEINSNEFLFMEALKWHKDLHNLMSISINFPYKRNTRSAKPRPLFRTTDADTIKIEQPLRLVSCDTTEKSDYAGRPDISQPKLDRCKERLNSGFYDNLPSGLREYLSEKITPEAAAKHINAGVDSVSAFESMLESRLTLNDGTKRKVAVIPTGDMIDLYGRLLAYVAPWFSNTAEDPLPPRDDPRRKTFNLEMIENGWAAFFPIYPSLPSNDDMNLAIAAAELAWRSQKGAWEEYGNKLLLGYEFRMCIKLSKEGSANDRVAEAFERICVDLGDLSIVGKYDFYDIDPSHRLWIWENDIEKAKVDLNLQ
jgi:endonuclease YncB( thermonuclease family)